MSLYKTAAALLAVLLAVGCQSTPPPAPPKATAGSITNPQNSQTYYKVLLAQMAVQRGEWDVAIANYLASAEETKDPQLAKQGAAIAFRQKKIADAFKAAKLWRDLAPHDSEALALHAVTAILSGQDDEAVEATLTLARHGEDSPDHQHQQLQRLVQLVGVYASGLLQDIAPQLKYPETAYLASAMAAQSRNDSAFAYLMVEKALQKNPSFLRALVYKAELLNARGEPQEAIDLLTNAEHHKGERLLSLSLGRLLYGQGLYDEAALAFDELRRSDDSDPEARYLYATSLYMAGQYENALPFLQESIRNNYQLSNAAWLCGATYERLKKWSEARACYAQVPLGNGYINAQRALAKLDERQGNVDAALTGLRQAYAQMSNPKESQPLLVSHIETLLRHKRLDAAKNLLDGLDATTQQETAFQLLALRIQHNGKAEAQRKAFAQFAQTGTSADDKRNRFLTAAGILTEQGYDAAAYSLLHDAVSKNGDDTELRYARALQAESVGKTEQAIRDLREVIAISPNHIDAMNALGFTLADHNRLLDEALDLVNRAHNQRPSSAAIIDSMGWVHYRRGDLPRATNLLRRAYAMDQEPEIAAHYGEALWMSGDKKKARQIWEEALTLDEKNKHVKERLNKYK